MPAPARSAAIPIIVSMVGSKLDTRPKPRVAARAAAD
jgi:hypothetical protein